jgi:hypothetical protein
VTLPLSKASTAVPPKSDREIELRRIDFVQHREHHGRGVARAANGSGRPRHLRRVGLEHRGELPGISDRGVGGNQDAKRVVRGQPRDRRDVVEGDRRLVDEDGPKRRVAGDHQLRAVTPRLLHEAREAREPAVAGHGVDLDVPGDAARGHRLLHRACRRCKAGLGRRRTHDPQSFLRRRGERDEQKQQRRERPHLGLH